VARRLLRSCAMQPIDPTGGFAPRPAGKAGRVPTPHLASLDRQALASVNGGFGALLGALLQAAPGILQGVSGIIGAAKSGGSAGSAPAGPTQVQPQQPDPSAAQAMASPAPAASQGSPGSPGGFPQVLVIRFG
jgi:hypothetical protein